MSKEAAPAGEERRRGAATAAAAPPWTTWRRLAESDMVGAKAAAEPARASTAQVLATADIAMGVVGGLADDRQINL